MAEKVIIGEWHDDLEKCSECNIPKCGCITVVRPTFVRVMCPSCFKAFEDVEFAIKALDMKTLDNWYQSLAIV